MRVLAALVLLLQLQPLVGGLLCLHRGGVGTADCAMPHGQHAAGGSLHGPEAGGAAGCAGIEYCASPAPAVPRFADRFHLSPPSQVAPSPADPSFLPGVPPAPPVDPPRA